MGGSGLAVVPVIAAGPNWAEQVTAIGTAVLALGVFGAVAAAIFGARQIREERRSRQAQMAADFFRRWNEEPLVEARRMIASFDSPAALASAFAAYVSENAAEAYVLYRELDYFEQLAALERAGAFDFGLIDLMIGDQLVDRWELWRPALGATHGEDAYPLYRDLVGRLRRARRTDRPAGGERASLAG